MRLGVLLSEVTGKSVLALVSERAVMVIDSHREGNPGGGMSPDSWLGGRTSPTPAVQERQQPTGQRGRAEWRRERLGQPCTRSILTSCRTSGPLGQPEADAADL